MSMIKNFMDQYCEAKYPDDFDAQERLFKQLCNWEVQPSMEEMQKVIDEYEYKKRKDE